MTRADTGVAAELTVGSHSAVWLSVRTWTGPNAALLVPVYWVMMSVAAVKAAYQLVFHPSYWEKTSHGLNEKYSHGPNTDRSPDLEKVMA